MLEDKIDNFEEKMENAKLLLALKLQESMKKKLTPNWGKDTGQLKSNIIGKLENKDIVFEMPKQGAYIEFGTPPHIISAKNAKSLHWKNESGKDVFAKQVKHPGTPPFPFIRDTFKKELTKSIVDAFNKAFK